MQYDSQGHVVAKDPNYPKAMHKSGTTVQALNPAHEAQLTEQGYSAKVWDKEVHGNPAPVPAPTAPVAAPVPESPAPASDEVES